MKYLEGQSSDHLLIIYINDMPDIVNDCLFIQYADGTQLLHSDIVDNFRILINKTEITLSKAKNYFLKNGLLINSKMTQCMFIGTRLLLACIPSDVTRQFDGHNIKPCKQVKNLGMYMDYYAI